MNKLFCWKNQHGAEVDFLLKEGTKIEQLVQVTYASKRDEIDEREVKSLLKASKEIQCENLTTVTWDYENAEKINNKTIRFTPLWKWLLID